METVDHINSYLIPRLNDFAGKCDALIESNKEMRDCIKKFEQDMLLKSNKNEILIFKNMIEEKFMIKNDWSKIIFDKTHNL